MEIPSIKPMLKGKSSYFEAPCELRKTYRSPVLDQYEKMASKFKSYIQDLSPKIEYIYEKENYRSYLKEQKLNMIKSQMCTKKEELEKQLEEKLDPTKSPNGKLHIEIQSLIKLQKSYDKCLGEIENNMKEKEKGIQELSQLVKKQRETIKGLLKDDFTQTQQKSTNKLPKINRNSSASSIWSKGSEGNYKHSRQSIMSKLGQSILDRTNRKLNQQEEKVIMLKLFLVFYQTDSEKHESGTKLIQSLEKEIANREDIIKEIKKQLSVQPQKSAFFFEKKMG